MTLINEVRRHLHLPLSIHLGHNQQAASGIGAFDFGSDVVICRITSMLHTGRFDVILSDWSAAGLAKPSVV